MNCEHYKTGIQDSVDKLLSPESMDKLLSPESMDAMVEYRQGDMYCGAVEDPECPSAVDTVIRSGLPLLAESGDGPMLHNMAVEGTCPARRTRLF